MLRAPRLPRTRVAPHVNSRRASNRIARVVAGLIAAAAVGVSACGVSERSAPDTATTAAVATVVVTQPLGGAIPVGSTIPMQVTVKSAQGQLLSGRVVRWSSRVPSVATVNADGVATALSPGSTPIDAEVDGVTGSTTVSVIAVPVASVQITPGTLSLLPHTTGAFLAVARDAAGTVVTGRTVAWSSSDLSTLSVNTAGSVTALAPGTATLQASVDGVVGTAMVTVLPRTLVLGQTVRGLTGAVGVPQFTIAIPNGTRGLLVRTVAGSGELALSLYQGDATTTDQLVCTSASASTRQLCAVAAPAPGVYTLRTTRYSAGGYAEVTLEVNPELPVLAVDGATVTGLSSDGALLYRVALPAGRSGLTVRTTEGSGSVTLTVFEGEVPASGWSRCASAQTGTGQQCTVTAPVAGVYTVRLTPGATGGFTGVTLQASTSP